ncbi:HpcH/HpaI aldolase/citrate lyase family protein [uncultured Maritimibacter sp.]|jgi:4-hydroxy-2-oxoheptanedioate aldolase|uniref:HpcH/HpaI aldolase family protein n=1 Tax=uncultured Maritimibacter sp. TaxID=991866 RepID=UPI000AE2D8B3|nr:HpcH/HpaI aldolase/citrate lyase family protein [uncultured Maritimibacter sp.]
MPAPENLFKKRLLAGETLIGLWCGLGTSVAELAAQTGFDWIVLDGEHGPNRLRDVLDQLRAVGTTGAQPVVRVRDDNRAEIKQMLDIGAQTILVPMIDTAEQAREAVRSVLYPPHGVRGVGAALARASAYGAIPDYLTTANDQICLLLQVENRAGIAALDDILAVERVDGIFIGPADLSTDMGHVGNPGHPEVQAVINEAIDKIRAAGKVPGILTSDATLNKGYAERGAGFVAVGSDVGALRGALTALRKTYD